MTGRAIRLLHLEDSEPDHALALVYLARSGLAVQATRIETRTEFEAALQQHAHGARGWDLVLSDYHLPGFTGIEALQMLRDSGSLLPFILVSGQIGEDTAVEAMRNGASDYLLKNNLSRLAPAVEHAGRRSARRARDARGPQGGRRARDARRSRAQRRRPDQHAR
ncbi:MAG: response regulator [Chitinophagaceae bacterium]|nr:response regulator [Rubrivivax sp.]